MRQELQQFDFNIICSTMSVGLVGGGGCDTGRFRFRFFFVWVLTSSSQLFSGL